MKKYNFRIAEERDKNDIIRMCYNFYEFSEYSKYRNADPQKVKETVEWYLSRPKNEAIVILLCDEDIPVGMMALMSAPTPFWQGFLASEQVWWVEEDHRGKESLRMVSIAEEWARRSGCTGICMSALDSNSSVSKIYERKGYKLSELAYLKGF